jgi:hypothetical protein
MPKVGSAVNLVVLWPTLLLKSEQLFSIIMRPSIGHGPWFECLKSHRKLVCRS